MAAVTAGGPLAFAGRAPLAGTEGASFAGRAPRAGAEGASFAGRVALARDERARIETTARALAETVTDPELPMLTLADLGVLRDVTVDDAGHVEVAITPTYSGCPAMATMRDDLVRTLRDAGLHDVAVRVDLSRPWTTDWISERGRAALRESGISPPGPTRRPAGPVALDLGPVRRAVRCPRCGSADTEVTSEFGSTACKALYRCRDCLEPFDHVKEI